MAYSSVPMVPRDGTLTGEDSTGGTPKSITIQYEDGDFSIDAVEEGYMNATFLKDRGMDYAVRKTDEQEVNFTFTCHATCFSSATDATPLDIALKTGSFAAGVSAMGASADAWLTKWTFTVEGTNYGLAADHVLTMSKVRISAAFSEGVPGKWTIKGKIFSPSTTITWAT